ncbi:MAG: hypothetical protein LBD38_02440, partial [Streptococcaceae bacterium]|nr:hypothetical protein [Streptococcaceae bacterium]
MLNFVKMDETLLGILGIDAWLKNGEEMTENLFDELDARGLIFQSTDKEEIRKKLNTEKVKLY